MFSLGSGAAIKLDIDISSEFALLPDAPIQVDQSLNHINDLGHATHSATPIPPDARETSSEAAIADETFFDEHAVNKSEISRGREAEHADQPAGATLTPDETAALAEMSRLKAALAAASSYGAGVNAAGKPARRRPDFARPSDVSPEAWADFGASQRKSVEAEFAAKRSLLRRQISELKVLRSDVDFEQLVRATSSGAVSIIVRPPLSSCDPWNWYDDESAFSGAIAHENFRSHANSHQCSELRSRAFALQNHAQKMLDHAKQIQMSSNSHGSIHHINGDESLDDASYLIDAAIPSCEQTVLQQASSKDSPAGSSDAPLSSFQDDDFCAFRAPRRTTPQSPFNNRGSLASTTGHDGPDDDMYESSFTGCQGEDPDAPFQARMNMPSYHSSSPHDSESQHALTSQQASVQASKQAST